MNEFLQGFIKGAKETPKGFFAPAIALYPQNHNVARNGRTLQICKYLILLATL